MIWGLDTHTLVWYLENNSKLGSAASALLDDPKGRFFVPTLVLCEVHSLAQKGKTGKDFSKILQYLKDDDRFEIVPLNETALHFLHPGLDIHDAVIVATALSLAKEKKDKVSLLTRDKKIQDLGLINVVWD